MAAAAQPQPQLSVDEIAQLCANNPIGAVGQRIHGRLDLRGRDLSGANLSTLDLRDCSLRGAVLRNCTFNETNLSECDFSEADLRGANLRKGRGLEAWQFRATDVRDAKLPKEIAGWNGLTFIGKLGPALSKQFLVLLAACLYCWLVMASTTDVELVLGSATQALPIIQTRMSIVLFYAVAPLLVFMAFAYFVLNLHLMWEALAKLPAIFPDGRRLDERSYPWPLIQKVRAYYSRLRSRKDYGLVPKFEIGLGSAITYTTAPITLFLFWSRTFPKHSMLLTGWIGLLFLTSIALAAEFHYYSVATLEGELPDPKLDRAAWKRRGVGKRVFRYCATGLLLGVATYYGAQRLPASLFAAELSTKPEGWVEHQSDLSGVRGAQLRSADLRNAILLYSFLAKANLSDADLRGADLAMADLRNANLLYGNLAGAHLAGAQLQGTELGGAKGLTRDQLKYAILDEHTILPTGLEDLTRDK